MSDTTYNRADIEPLDRDTLGVSVCGASFAPKVKYSAIPAAKEVVCGGGAGEQGPAGPQGEPGPEGPQGLQGPAGPEGPRGPKGDRGSQGPKGDDGTPFAIAKVFTSVVEMEADDTVEEGSFVIIASTEQDPDNAKLYVKTQDGYSFVTDMSGAQGIAGPKGDPGDVGPRGPKGNDGAQGPEGPQGQQGPAGPTGPRGETGPEGPVGRNGINGKSAHELWVEQGNQGDVRAFLLSLVGPTGPTGEVGPKGDDGRSLSIKKTFASITEMEQDTSVEEGELMVIATDVNNEDNGKLFVKTDAGYNLIADLSGADGIRGERGPAGPAGPRGLQGPAGPIGNTGASGKSAYQTWLDLGNTGNEAAFIASLTGPRGPQGDTSNLGAAGASKYIITLSHNSVNITQDFYKTFTHHSTTQWGNVHLDFTPSTTLGQAVTIGRLPAGAPRPVELIEVNAIGSGGAVGQVYIETDGIIRVNNLTRGQRYIINIPGYFR